MRMLRYIRETFAWHSRDMYKNSQQNLVDSCNIRATYANVLLVPIQCDSKWTFSIFSRILVSITSRELSQPSELLAQSIATI